MDTDVPYGEVTTDEFFSYLRIHDSPFVVQLFRAFDVNDATSSEVSPKLGE